MTEPPLFKISPVEDSEGDLYREYEEALEKLRDRHNQAREWFLYQCLDKVKKLENVPSLPLDQLRSCGRVVTSQVHHKAMAFSWKTKHIACLTWDMPGGSYQVHDEPQFPYQEEGSK